MMEKITHKLNEWGLTPRRALVILGALFLFILVMDFNNRVTDLFRLSAQRDQLETEMAALTATLNYLGTEIAYAGSTQAVEDWARLHHGGKDGDIPIVILPPAQATPLPPVHATPTPRVVANWQVWWALFFGE